MNQNGDVSVGDMLLSTASLGMLDQASAYKRKDYPEMFVYIDSLEGIEKRVFLRALQKENKPLADKYNEILDNINRQANNARWDSIAKATKEREAQEQAIANQWPIERIEESISKICPALCGIFIKDKYYYKQTDFKSTILNTIDVIKGMCSFPSLIIATTLDMIKSIKPNQTSCISNSPDYNFYLCHSPDARQALIIRLAESIKKADTEAVSNGYLRLD